jgi:hypothetical protein
MVRVGAVVAVHQTAEIGQEQTAMQIVGREGG